MSGKRESCTKLQGKPAVSRDRQDQRNPSFQLDLNEAGQSNGPLCPAGFHSKGLELLDQGVTTSDPAPAGVHDRLQSGIILVPEKVLLVSDIPTYKIVLILPLRRLQYLHCLHILEKPSPRIKTTLFENLPSDIVSWSTIPWCD